MKNPFPWSNIYESYDNGILNVTPNTSEIQRIEVSDFFNNKTVITIPVKYSAKPALIKEDDKDDQKIKTKKVQRKLECVFVKNGNKAKIKIIKTI
jgi:kynurenine formamidase